MSLPVNPPIVFMDTETTSLRPDRRFWDIAAIRRSPDGGEEVFQYFVHVDELRLDQADPASLRIGRFYERHPQMADHRGNRGVDTETGQMTVTYERAVLEGFEQLTRGAIIVGAVPNFDTEVIAARMRAHRLAPSWHYHLVDVETLAAGQLGFKPPWSFDEILATYQITVDEQKRHTALGDAELNMYLYDAIFEVAERRIYSAAGFINHGGIARGGELYASASDPGIKDAFDIAKKAETGEPR